MTRPIKSLLLSGVLLCLAAGCAPPQPEPAHTLRWADGDSGEIDGQRFRLAEVDAPEIGDTALCNAEVRSGRSARDFMRTHSRGATISYVLIEPEDRYGRIVVDILADGQSLTDRALDAGHLQPWPHLNGRALGPKPDWCG